MWLYWDIRHWWWNRRSRIRTLADLVELAQRTSFVYIHDENGDVVAVVLAKDSWWYEQLPAAPEDERFAHDHVSIDGGRP